MSAKLAVRGGATIDHGRLLDVLGIEGELIATAAHRLPTDRRVPGCPGWTVGDTVRHVGELYRTVRSRLIDRSRPVRSIRSARSNQPARPSSVDVEPGPDGSLTSWLRSITAEFAAHSADEPCSSWWPADESYGFWCRRLAHESTLHRVDVQAATGVAPTAIADDIAIDGVDEVLRLWFAHRLRMLGVSGTRSTSVLVRAGDRRWLVRIEPGSTIVRVGDAAGAAVDAMITAEPASMYLWLWGRLPVNAVRVDGDLDAAAQLWALLRVATH